MINIDNISKNYDRGRIAALRAVNFSVNEGEIFGLVGADGAGKTTLFRLLATLLLPDGGRASVGGFDVVRDYRRVRRIIGYMPGRFSLYPDLTVEENLRFFAAVFGVKAERNLPLVADIYEHLQPFRTRRADQLSGGMKQKLALCCALIHAPRLLLLDEPTTGIDPVSRRELWEMLRRLNEERGLTIVAGTPYREEVLCCRRAALLREGRLEAVGRPDEILPPERPIGRQRSIGRGNPVIVAEGLTKRFGDFTACDSIDLRVEAGEIFGFLGANGAGKTTAMRMLCGLSEPTEGRAFVAGFDVASQAEEVKRNIGYMSQKFALYDDLTIEENLKLFGAIYGMKASVVREKTEQTIARQRLERERKMPVGNLPIGLKQRLAFAVATFHDPKIVFLDEPTGGVDAETRHRFWELIGQAADRGITIFVTTHYMDEAERCDRVSIMVDGRIEALDTPSSLKEKHGAASMHDVFFAIVRKQNPGGRTLPQHPTP